MMTTKNKEGILLLNKPAGKTSFYLVYILRKILGVQKIGHAGTLDPFATGVMVMLVGKKYTRLSDTFLTQSKTYRATLHLGIETDTYDCDGTILSRSDKVPTQEQVEEALTHFQGTRLQIPPMFSAKKINGQKLCDLARKGIELERKPVPVTLETTLLRYSYPYLEIDVTCSKGTYIRSIAHDIGKLLGTGAHLSSLIRTQSGPFSLENCLSIEDLNPISAMEHLRS
jgi:tRNA pseudouridine55 synthase